MLHYTLSPLFTDLYQLTMAYGYWQLGLHEREANFHLLFRKNPFKGHYALACGLESIINFLTHWQFKQDELDYLATLRNHYQKPLFSNQFLDYLSTLRFSAHLEAVPEGTIIFPHMPILRIQGPLIQCQLIESPLLNIINFQTLIATKASRVVSAAANDRVIEFGMRRAQGPDGAISASRAAYIGGCQASSNTLAGKLFDIPVSGTHAHSWVTVFTNELEAFKAYAKVMPYHCIFLVDTYNTVEGVKHAITVGKQLRKNGADLLAIRLDSGDMATLSKKARALLDEADFKETDIIASNSLDEYMIKDLKQKGAQISRWGVGTHLVTAHDWPALDGVYKLSALQDEKANWQYKLKLSEQGNKTSNPGRHQVRRFYRAGKPIMDVIYDLDLGIKEKPNIILLEKNGPSMALTDYDHWQDLLKPVLAAGKKVSDHLSIHHIRTFAMQSVKAYLQDYPEQSYSVGLEKNVWLLKEKMIKTLRPVS